MFADDKFSHYLTYGATDQHTIIELSSHFDGLIVPATVAAFQRDGTGGFVLTLSATSNGGGPEYVIDPRSPLFQQALTSPKKSHEALAALLGDPDLVSTDEADPATFDDARIRELANKWSEFNLGYDRVSEKFEKYAKRLKEKVAPENSKLPAYVLAPYFMANGIRDPWWGVSTRLFNATRRAVGETRECVRVIALKDTQNIAAAIDSAKQDKAAIWVSDLHELQSDSRDLMLYLQGIEHARSKDTKLFALYGGFFSVLAGTAGLSGSCHGIGFGEHRNWIELPQSGPAPARYYVPKIHRYLSQEDAFGLWRENTDLIGCDCVDCRGRSPLELQYHELMKHSVRCRAVEIEEWAGLTPATALDRLTEERDEFSSLLDDTDLPDRTKEKYLRSANHLQRWIEAMTRFLVL